MSLKIKRHLAEAYPEHAELFVDSKTIQKLKPRPISLPEAVVRVVAGQMLSGAAARTIYGRITAARDANKLAGSWLLDHQSLRNCGLSNSKAQAIVQFGSKIGNSPNSLDHWKQLPIEDLYDEIKSNKGMGDWSAGIIALFYVGHEDVFPKGDGSLNRAVEILSLRQRQVRRAYTFEPDIAQPYRSYLALYLWQALDSGQLG